VQNFLEFRDTIYTTTIILYTLIEKSQGKIYKRGDNELTNIDIKDEIKKNRIKHWEIAEQLRITETAFSKRFRKELTEPQKNEIRRIIQEIKNSENAFI